MSISGYVPAYITETFSESIVRRIKASRDMKHFNDRHLNATGLKAGQLIGLYGTIYQFDTLMLGDKVHLTDEYGRGFIHDRRSFELTAYPGPQGKFLKPHKTLPPAKERMSDIHADAIAWVFGLAAVVGMIIHYNYG